MKCRTGTRIVKRFSVILTYFVLLCTVSIVSDRTNKSDVPTTKRVYRRHSPSEENDSSYTTKDFKECSICGRADIVRRRKKEFVHDGKHNKLIRPWMVKLVNMGRDQTLRNEGPEFSYNCSGSILNKYYILTAAHCVVKGQCPATMAKETCLVQPNKMDVFLLDSSHVNFTRGPPVENIFIHPEYETIYATSYNDIGILKLEKPITCTAFASPICLPPSNFSVPEKIGYMFRITGIGKTRHNRIGPVEGDLMESEMRLEEPDKCPQANSTLTYCLTGRGSRAVCHGNSGGPMYMRNEEAYYVIGITVWGLDELYLTELCRPYIPYVYTKVASYMEWIKKITSIDSTPFRSKDV